MTDEELIARLRSNIFGTGTTMLASDRIEALTEQRDAAIARAETALAIAEEALRGAIAAIDAAYDGPGDNGAYTVRERAALAEIEALKGGEAECGCVIATLAELKGGAE